jgi:hypothetical protein
VDLKERKKWEKHLNYKKGNQIGNVSLWIYYDKIVSNYVLLTSLDESSQIAVGVNKTIEFHMYNKLISIINE